MKKIATFFLVLMMFTSSSLCSQTRKETTVKLEWQEQGFVHFYTAGYSVYVSKPDFLSFQNELLAGLFDEYADKNDSINLMDPFPIFKTEQRDLLWSQLMHCAAAGQMLIIPNDSKKKLKSIIIIDDTSLREKAGTIWECLDPRTNHVIFSHNISLRGTPDF